MAQEIPDPDSPPAPLNELVHEHIEALFEPGKLTRVETILGNALQRALTRVIGVVLSLSAKIGAFLAKSIADAESSASDDFNRLASVAIADMFNVSPPAMNARRGSGGNTAAADAVGDALVKAFSGQARGSTREGSGIEPSDAPAKAFLSAMAQLALEGWLEGWIVEAFSLGQIETFGDLDDTISHVLGLGRASASVHGPFVEHLIRTPLDWKLRKEHRPALLSASTVMRQFARGRWDWADVVEELARQGYSDERIDALKNEQRKFLSVSDVALIAHRVGGGGGGAGGGADFSARQIDPIEYLAEAGYDELDARDQLLVESARTLDQQEKQLANACVAAFVRGDISDAEFDRAIDSIKLPAADADHFRRLARLQQGFQRKRLTSEQAARLAIAGILAVADYRAALEREGYPPNDVAALELELRARIDAVASVAELKARQAAEKTADKVAADQARAARLAQQAIADALPSLGEVRRAFVRGFLPVDRYRAAVVASHPGIADGDVAALVADAQHDHDVFVAQQAKHDAAVAGDKDPALPLSVLEQSVISGITTIDSYDRELARRGYDDAERGVFVALLRERIADERTRQAARAKADAKAQTAGISIGDFERAVRLGLRTMDQFAAVLKSLGVPDVERAVQIDLLKADVKNDQAAAAKRVELDAKAKLRAIDLPLRRRAVLAGALTRDQYAQALNRAGVSTDDQALELALLDLELADRRRTQQGALPLRRRAVLAGILDRDDYATALQVAGVPADQATLELGLVDQELAQHPPPTTDGPTLSLSQVESAVVLGILAPDDLRAYLSDRGYTDDDVETLVALTVAKIPDARAGATRQTAIAAELKTKGVSLATIESAVVRGVRTLDDYAGELATRGYGDDDVALLRQLLTERIAVQADTLRKKITASLAAATDAPTIQEFDRAVGDQSVSAAAARAYLVSVGVAADVALVYVRLVVAGELSTTP